MKRTGIKELASMLSLNPSTVSRALADHPDIKKETKERVKAAAEAFNYHPNLHARFFRKKSSSLIALILPEFNMFFVPELLNGITEYLNNLGLSPIIFYTNNSFEKEKEALDLCISWMVDGVLISLSDNTKTLNHLDVLLENEIPVVMLDKVIDSDKISTVSIDDHLAAYEATKHLVYQDKRNILGVFASKELTMTQHRLNGFKKCLEDNKIAFSDFDFVFTSKEEGSDKIDKKLRSTPYDGVFIISDELLMMTYPILLKNRLIPGQVNVSVISDGLLPYQLYPKISHIRHSGYEVGVAAVKTLHKHIKKEILEPQSVHVSTSLITLS